MNICFAADPKNRGEPPVFIYRDLCPDCKQWHDFEVCPVCFSDIAPGLAADHSYWICENLCGWSYVDHIFSE